MRGPNILSAEKHERKGRESIGNHQNGGGDEKRAQSRNNSGWDKSRGEHAVELQFSQNDTDVLRGDNPHPEKTHNPSRPLRRRWEPPRELSKGAPGGGFLEKKKWKWCSERQNRAAEAGKKPHTTLTTKDL